MLLVHSKSTEQYADDWGWDRKMLVTSPPTGDTLLLSKEEDVIAIGGGSVIDTAKIISKNPIIAIPTTYSGASRTSHAVYWHSGRKYDRHTEKPITIVRPGYLEQDLLDLVIYYSRADCICHTIESLASRKSNAQSRFYASMALSLIKKEEWLDSSLLAGDAVEITGTNVIHALSYTLTTIYGVPHGRALAFLLPKFASYLSPEDMDFDFDVDLDIDVERVVDEALTYPKIFDCKEIVTREVLVELVR